MGNQVTRFHVTHYYSPIRYFIGIFAHDAKKAIDIKRGLVPNKKRQFYDYDEGWYGTYLYRPDTSTLRVPKWDSRGNYILNVFFLYWMIWHFYYHYDHLLGHYTVPDPADWTDEELGIPPDVDDVPFLPKGVVVAANAK